MISKYPEYNKKEVFTTDIDNVLEFITMFRNKKAELGNIGEYRVIVNIEDETSKNIIVNMLKIGDKIVTEGNGTEVKLGDMEIVIVYDNTKNLEDEKEKLLKEKENLESSIARREKLLSNEGYVNKAPRAIVDKERECLEKEKDLLNNILVKLN